jgi:hypothetical protein
VASPLEIRRYLNPLPSWLVQVLPLFSVLAIVGFVLSVWVNVGAITSRWTAPSYFWVLHVGIFVVFFPAVFVAQKRVGNTNRKDLWKIVLKGAPDWMKYFLYAVFAYAFATGIPSWIRAGQQPHAHGATRASGIDDWTGFSATWMVFYWTGTDKLSPREASSSLSQSMTFWCRAISVAACSSALFSSPSVPINA